jgi:hypothetical protein
VVAPPPLRLQMVPPITRLAAPPPPLTRMEESSDDPPAIPRFEKVKPKPLYVCPGCSNHTYSNNMITDVMFDKTK